MLTFENFGFRIRAAQFLEGRTGLQPVAVRARPSSPRQAGSLSYSALDGAGGCPYVVAMSKSMRAGDAATNTPPFEEALKKLETIVETMESDDLPLETLLAKYEEGTK
jgi:hypothetical protein